MANPDEQLQAARERLEQARRAEREFTRQQEALQTLRARLQTAENELRREQRDVERLEQLTLTGVLARLRGDREARLDKEEAEAASAAMRLQLLRSQVESAQETLARLDAERASLSDARQEYERALDAKTEWLTAQGSPVAERLAELAEEAGLLSAQRREVDEALAAGGSAADAVDRALDDLGSAAGLGVWDLAGGDLLATMAKRTRINEAQREVEEAQRHLNLFRAELEDVAEYVAQYKEVGDRLQQLRVSGGDLERFGDYFFDNFFMDLFVQGRIDKTRDAMVAVGEQLRSVMRALEDERDRIDDRLSAIRAERANAVESA